ncbi:uncharacterized protein C19orf44 homolog isoform X2 [Oryzias melastigma]|uniref:DUF4614 domain-containing protein n=1 Tax=Oryzias melastigma TaxID=30732 RepID=A0A3B3B5B1_ORYME|nr:uncharacterized protein C19orf44 homolog isoform X2 [Oryzias melastigma]
MWRRGGGRSAVLNRAEALLAGRSSGTQGSFKTASKPPNKQVSFHNLSDLSADSSADATGGEENSEQDLRPHSRFGGGSRFLKKAPPPKSSSQSPVSRKQNLLEPRSVPASQQESQSKIPAEPRSSVQASENTVREASGASLLSISTASATQQRPAQWNCEQSPGGSRFLRKKKIGTGAAPAAALTTGADVGDTPLLDLESKPGRAERGVSVDSDEEYMRKLLGDSVDPSDSSLAEEGRRSPLKEPQKRTSSTPSPPSSASHRRSPFRYSGQGQNHFNPSVSSPSTPLPEMTGDSPKAESPRRLSSSSSECVEVLSVAEQLLRGSVSSEAQSKKSEVSEDFHINIKNLDELIPASTSQAGSQDQSKQSDPGSWGGHQQLSQEDEEVQDYQSDFHSYSGGTRVSEELSEDEEAPSEIRSDSTESEVSSSLEPRRHASQTSVRGSSKQRRISSSSKKPLKDAAVQTQPDHLTHDDASVPPSVAAIYLSAAAGRGYALSAEQLEDISAYNPAVFVVSEVLKQQLAMTKELVDSNRRLHANLMQSLEPPSYRYTTLRDTIQSIRRLRPAKPATERHLEEVLQEFKYNLHSDTN